MLFSLVGAIFGALKAWVLRVVFGCAEVVLKQCCPGVEMGGKRTFAVGAYGLKMSICMQHQMWRKWEGSAQKSLTLGQGDFQAD
jgi:hypothetical protein